MVEKRLNAESGNLAAFGLCQLKNKFNIKEMPGEKQNTVQWRLDNFACSQALLWKDMYKDVDYDQIERTEAQAKTQENKLLIYTTDQIWPQPN